MKRAPSGVLRELRIGAARYHCRRAQHPDPVFVCTKTADVSGVILGEVDFLAGAQAKVDAMIAKAKERASKAAMRS